MLADRPTCNGRFYAHLEFAGLEFLHALVISHY